MYFCICDLFLKVYFFILYYFTSYIPAVGQITVNTKTPESAKSERIQTIHPFSK